MSGSLGHLRLIAGRREPVLATTGGGPHDPDMEARLTRLEGDFLAMHADLSATRADTAYIRGRLESLPTTWSMITAIIAGNLSLGALLVGAARLLGH
jgi:hypothetical protein